MKGFLEWFKSKAKLKRWMILILIGIVLVCYTIANIIQTEVMEITSVAYIIIGFIIGFALVIIGFIYMQKRTLELLIEAETKTDNPNIQSLIFNKNIYDKGPKIVVIGGGNGMNTVLQGLKEYSSNITAIVNVSDGEKLLINSREEIDVLKSQDIKDSFIALANNEIAMDKLLNYTFQEERLKALSFGDIYLSAMKDIYGNLADCVEASGNVLNIVGRVIPVTLDRVNVSAELKDGTIVEDRSKISETMWEKVSPISKISVIPSNARPAPGVLEAIRDADAIIIGPGSLYTNILPNLLIKGVAKAIKESVAMKIYISNIMTEPGQTDDFTVSSHIEAIKQHVGGGLFEFCIADTGELTPEFIKRYNLKGSDLVETDVHNLKAMGMNIIKKDMSMIKGENIRHDPKELAETIIELVCNDLKFKDLQNNPQFVLLNSKQKAVKKENKQKNHAKAFIKKEFNKQIKANSKTATNSKFNKKYKDRIKAIKTTEQNREENIRLYETSVELYEKKFIQPENEKQQIKKVTKKIKEIKQARPAKRMADKNRRRK